MQKTLLLLAALATLGGCTWETYQDNTGHTRLRQKYPAGSGIYYTEGAASQNTHYHKGRPVQHAIVPNRTREADEEEAAARAKPSDSNAPANTSIK